MYKAIIQMQYVNTIGVMETYRCGYYSLISVESSSFTL